MPTVGYATLQIIPSVRGISDELRRQLVGPASDSGDRAGQAAGGGLKDKLVKGAAAAGAAAGALLVAGITEAMDQASITSNLQAQLGTTGKVAAAQGKVAGKLYSSGVSGSFQDAADAIKAVVQSGLAPPDATNAQLRRIATKASDVANIFGQDLGGVTNAVSQMMRTGLAKNSSQAFDLITKGFQSGTDKGGDFLDTINEYGTQFRKSGLDGASAIGLLNQAIKGGARDADLAADAIKEFGIRAVDGSQSTADGFKALGLNADNMAAKFAKGGKSANGVLDLTLDRLRGIKDPVKQAQIATQLFGTQAEDLGKALFAMDPSSATKGLGKFAGATDKAGKAIRSGPSHEIEVFTRSLKQGFVSFIGGQVLPVVSTLAHGFNTYLLPPLRLVGAVVAATLIPALQALFSAGMAVGNWLRSMGAWLIPIGIAVAGFTAAILAQQIATAATTAVFAVYRGAILAWTAVQRGATIAQAAFNAVMNANPVMLVITAIVALGAALVVAYQKSATFRGIVQGAWQGIQTGALWLWNSALKPMFEGFKVGLAAIGTAAQWLWGTVLSPVFSFISTAVRLLATIIVTILVAPVVLAVRALGAVFSWLWTNAISPVIGWIVAGVKLLWAGILIYLLPIRLAFRAVGAVAKWLWTNAISPAIGWIVAGVKVLWSGIQIYFGYVKTAFRAVGNVAKWLWHNVISPVFKGIGAVISWWWTNVIQRIFGFVRSALRTLGNVFKWLYNNVIKPVWDKIKAVINFVWEHGIKPAFDKVKSAVKKVGDAFKTARDAIKKAWDKLMDIAKKPVRFIINTVYNKGIVPVWNKVASAFGAKKIGKMDISGWATGGVLPGYTPGRDVHLAALSGGEAVMRPEWTRAMGPGYVNAMNALARRGGVGAVQRATGGSLPGFADGGIFGWIGKGLNKVSGWGSKAWDKVKEGAKWLKDTLAASARAGVKNVVNPLLSKIPGLDNSFGRMIKGIPTKIVDAIFGYAKKADDKGASTAAFGGGKIPKGQHAAIIKAALRAAGVPPPGTMGQWLSGMNTLITRESGWNSRAINRWDSNAKAGHPSQGLAQTIPGTFNAYVPKSLKKRGILDPVANVAAAIRYIVSRYGNITRVQQANANRPPAGYDSGGWLQPGLTTAINKTGRPEAVLTSAQWQVMSTAARQGPGGLQPGDSLTLVVDGHEFHGYVDARANGRIQASNQQLADSLRARR